MVTSRHDAGLQGAMFTCHAHLAEQFALIVELKSFRELVCQFIVDGQQEATVFQRHRRAADESA
jgi:hypothetical protein